MGDPAEQLVKSIENATTQEITVGDDDDEKLMKVMVLKPDTKLYRATKWSSRIAQW